MTRSRGFTLIELLVVIAIIGLLASIVMASLSTAKTKGADAARISDVKSLETALELYNNDNNGYPTSNGSGNGDVGLGDATLVGKLVPKYIPSMPALLVADGDHYYAEGATSGVSANYDMLIYIAATNSWCRAGTVPGSTGDWALPTVCNF
jgi:prepilin-type N-terminal cleavage/methylation domain-containing protein